MKKSLLFCSFIICSFLLKAQNSEMTRIKPAIDFDAIRNWPILNPPGISNDGNWLFYPVFEVGRGRTILTVIDSSLHHKKEIDLKGAAYNFFFTDDSKNLVFENRDSLFFYTLREGSIKLISRIKNFKVPLLSKGKWIAYRTPENENNLVLMDLLDGSTQTFTDILEYGFENYGRTLLVKLNTYTGAVQNEKWQCVDLEFNRKYDVWQSKNDEAATSRIVNYNFDKSGKKLCFMVEKVENGNHSNSIWQFTSISQTTNMLIDDHISERKSDFMIVSGEVKFGGNGDNIFFSVQNPPQTVTNKQYGVMVDVWSYKDVILQSQQLNDDYFKSYNSSFLAAYNVTTKNVVRLESEEEKVITLPEDCPGDYVITHDKQNTFWWRRDKEEATYVISLIDGNRTKLKKEWSQYFKFSPDGKYIVFFDGRSQNYFAYDVGNGVLKNISLGIKSRLDNEYGHFVPGRTYNLSFEIAAWAQDEAVLVYDNFDIWRLDMRGVKKPINLTNGFGQKNHMKLRIADGNTTDLRRSNIKPILLESFNVLNKYNGFYSLVSTEEARDPQKLVMSPALYYRENSQIPNGDVFSSGMKPVKARDLDLWIIRRETAEAFPNYFLTRDFKNFEQLTNLQPEKNYSWITSQLITWRQFDGTTSQGILYKPENFDPKKKYPLIFSYYETMSHRMYEYPRPELTEARIDISWFVSRGYLVFTPDIHYFIGNISGKTIGDCAYNSIVSAAKYLSVLPFVDGRRMALQGHSFSGYETGYVIAQSNIFKAACEASGTTDLVSSYLGIGSPNGIPSGDGQGGIETGQRRSGATLWQNPDLYLRGSIVLKADRINAPLLIMHNYGDDQIDWKQGIELYLALRRLEKPVWLLQYDGQGHVLNGKAAKDFTIRITQFFDHYLKNEAAPLWMTEGVPATLKGIEGRYGLDNLGRCADRCDICNHLQTTSKNQ